MPVLRNPKHERFAQLLATGINAVDAYEQSGYRRADSNASHLANKPMITTRVQEIIGVVAEQAISRAAVSVDGLIAEVEEARRGAIADGQWAAAIAATKEKGVLTGKRIERSERGVPGEFEWLETADVQSLAEFVASGELPESVH